MKYILSRHHEKLIAIDDTYYVGSSNFTDEYGGSKYGSNHYWDLNYKMKNILGMEIR